MKLKTEWHNITFYELMTNIFIAFFSIQGLIKGISYFTQSQSVIYQNDVYIAISTIMSLQTYGIIFILASLVLLVSVFITGNTSLLIMSVGNICLFLLYLLYSLASSHNATLEVTTYLNVLYTIVHLLVGIVGALVVWRKVSM